MIVLPGRRVLSKTRFGAIFSYFVNIIKEPYYHQAVTVGTSKTSFSLRKMEKSDLLKSVMFDGKLSSDSFVSKSNLTIAVEGNVGSGKSTLLRHFDNSSYIETVCEPLEKWTNVKGHNALGLLYEDPARWSFSFNMYAMLTRVNMHTKISEKPVKMLERSLYSTKYCFIENSYRSGTLKKFENSILNQWYDYLTSEKKAELDLIIYVRADPEVCYERLLKRSRKEEACVPQEFLESLHNLHEDWLIHKKYHVPAPVLVLDANCDMTSMKERYDQAQKEILCIYS